MTVKNYIKIPQDVLDFIFYSMPRHKFMWWYDHNKHLLLDTHRNGFVPRLGLNLIPEASFEKNLHSKLHAEIWADIAGTLKIKCGYKCQFCGELEDVINKRFLHTHEVWSFNLMTLTQKLENLECLCAKCHSVHHWGRSLRVKDFQPLDLFQHACIVNECSPSEFIEYLIGALALGSLRGNERWKIDWGEFQDVIDSKKNGVDIEIGSNQTESNQTELIQKEKRF